MNSNPFSLNGKFLLVTGASSGIGRQCAITCSQMGAKIVVMGRDQKRLEDTLNLMKSPEQHILCSVDLLEYDQVQGTIKDLVEQNRKIDGLINCAGISTTLPFSSVSPQKMDNFFKKM